MNQPTPVTDSRKDSIAAAIGVLVLLIGTATGNAYAMLAMSVVALAVMVILYRRGLSRNMIRAIIVAAAMAIVLAIAVSRL
jgi:hypothetical protein